MAPLTVLIVSYGEKTPVKTAWRRIAELNDFLEIDCRTYMPNNRDVRVKGDATNEATQAAVFEQERCLCSDMVVHGPCRTRGSTRGTVRVAGVKNNGCLMHWPHRTPKV